MNFGRLARLSLLWRILIPASLTITLLFAVTGWIVQEQLVNGLTQSIDDEARASFSAYESIWQARAAHLDSLSLVLSRMPDVRAAFGTGDPATIRDTASELWARLAREGTIFLVTDPRGQVLASFGGFRQEGGRELEMVRRASSKFPQQVSGFRLEAGRLFQTVVTPVYVDATSGTALINVLVAGYEVNTPLANRLKEATGGSDFVFLRGGTVAAASLPLTDASELLPVPGDPDQLPHVRIGRTEYARFATTLRDVEGGEVGELLILRSFESASRRLRELRRNIIAVWALAVLVGVVLAYLLTNRILERIKALDAAAARVSQGDYAARVEVGGSDELGRLAGTFNGMAESVRTAREELIRQERMTTISRLSTSIIHDLRNPLAAIYSGAEMLVDGGLPASQIRRLAMNIHRSSQRVQSMLNDMADVTKGRPSIIEPCQLREVVESARQTVSAEAEFRHVEIRVDVPEEDTVRLDRSRIERVFENLLLNAVEAMPSGGEVRVTSEANSDWTTVAVQDSGPGISPNLRGSLFEPFVTSGKKRGMGLGLALSRQTVRDHGGDLWLDASASSGARFVLRLPR